MQRKTLNLTGQGNDGMNLIPLPGLGESSSTSRARWGQLDHCSDGACNRICSHRSATLHEKEFRSCEVMRPRQEEMIPKQSYSTDGSVFLHLQRRWKIHN